VAWKIDSDIFPTIPFRFVTIHAFDRQTHTRTDGQTVCLWLIPPCVVCSAAKTLETSSDRHFRKLESLNLMAMSEC